MLTTGGFSLSISFWFDFDACGACDYDVLETYNKFTAYWRATAHNLIIRLSLFAVKKARYVTMPAAACLPARLSSQRGWDPVDDIPATMDLS